MTDYLPKDLAMVSISVTQALQMALRRELHQEKLSETELMLAIDNRDEDAWADLLGDHPVETLKIWGESSANRVSLVNCLTVAAKAQAPRTIVDSMWDAYADRVARRQWKGLVADGASGVKNMLIALLNYVHSDCLPRVWPELTNSGSVASHKNFPFRGFIDRLMMESVPTYSVGQASMSRAQKNVLLERWLDPDGWNVSSRLLDYQEALLHQLHTYEREETGSPSRERITVLNQIRDIVGGWPTLLYQRMAHEKELLTPAVKSAFLRWKSEGLLSNKQCRDIANKYVQDVIKDWRKFGCGSTELAKGVVEFVAGQEYLQSVGLPSIAHDWCYLSRTATSPSGALIDENIHLMFKVGAIHEKWSKLKPGLCDVSLWKIMASSKEFRNSFVKWAAHTSLPIREKRGPECWLQAAKAIRQEDGVDLFSQKNEEGQSLAHRLLVAMHKEMISPRYENVDSAVSYFTPVGFALWATSAYEISAHAFEITDAKGVSGISFLKDLIENGFCELLGHFHSDNLQQAMVTLNALTSKMVAGLLQREERMQVTTNKAAVSSAVHRLRL